MKVKDSQSQFEEVAVATLSDAIEAYLLQQLAVPGVRALEIQRAEVAERFGCVPSQVTYVLVTRFTPERGFLVEARRGGGGGIRISRLRQGADTVLGVLSELAAVDQRGAENVVRGLAEQGWVTTREARMLLAGMDRQVLDLPMAERDRIRARLLSAMLLALVAATQDPEAEEGQS
jgi:transcriptional regulator CtsR